MGHASNPTVNNRVPITTQPATISTLCTTLMKPLPDRGEV